MLRRSAAALLAALMSAPIAVATRATADEFSWLEEVHSKRALQWVQAQNERTVRLLSADPRYARFYEAALAVHQDSRRVPGTSYHDAILSGGWIYNLWRDGNHSRGLWRRTSVESYRTANPQWQTLLDMDELARAEKRNWQLQLAPFACLPPQLRRCLVRLSEAGSNVVALREFDVEARTFVPNGFALPEAPLPTAVWLDENTLLAVTEWDADSLSKGGAPFVVRRWSRGQPPGSAPEAFRGSSDSTWVYLGDYWSAGKRVLVAQEWSPKNHWVLWKVDAGGRFARMTLPDSEMPVLSFYQDHWVVSPSKDWRVAGRTWKADSLLAVADRDVTRKAPRIDLILAPRPRQIIKDGGNAADGLLVVRYTNVQGKLLRINLRDERWQVTEVALPDGGTITPAMSNPRSRMAFVAYQSFLQPTSIYEVDVTAPQAAVVKSEPSYFDTERFVTEQHEASSADGTKVPYFLVRAANGRFNGETPTLMYGYGGFGMSEFPTYSGTLGRLWLEEGGAYVLANIRGGDELGAAWHVVKTQRQRVYEDFVAVAEDLIRRRVTSPTRLGVYGASNGGLLAGVMLTRHPDLINAAVLEVPVLDQLRLDLVSGGEAGFAHDYGSLEIPQERAFLESTSPFQNLRRRNPFPSPLIVTATSDDNVQPGQPRRFAAKMESLGLPFLYYESAEGGHTGWSTPEQHAMSDALRYTYLAQRLIEPRARSHIER